MADDEEKKDPVDEAAEKILGEKEDEEEEETEKKRLVKGDYVIQCHVIEARELKGKDFGATSDPMCEVEVLGQKKTTAILSGQLNPIWDERLTWDLRNVEPGDLNMGKMICSVYDANLIRKNVLIGAFEFDLETIYYNKHHEMFNQWVTLIDITGENKGAQGFLKVTAVVLGPGDQQKEHTREEMLDLGGALFEPLMPPAIDPVPFLLTVYIYKYDHLAALDSLIDKSSDPYFEAKFAAFKEKTTYVKQETTYDLKKALLIPVDEPVLGDKIVVSCYDYDRGRSDDLIGQKTYSWEICKQTDGYPPHFIHFYGAPVWNDDHKLADKMNRGAIEGVWYRGTALTRLTGQQLTDEQVENLKPGETDAHFSDSMMPKTVQWVLQCDIYQGVECLDGSHKYAIQMNIRDTEYITDFVTCNENGSAEWYEVMGLEDKPKVGFGDRDTTGSIPLQLPEDVAQCPDVIFYLVIKEGGVIGQRNRIVSYRRYSWEELYKQGFAAPPKWVPFTATPILKSLSEEEFPGSILMGVRLGLADDKPPAVPVVARPFLNVSTVDDPLGSPSSSQSQLADPIGRSRSMAGTINAGPTQQAGGGVAETIGKLKVVVVKAEDVPSVDRDGSADPFVTVVCNGMEKKTRTIKDSLRPIWGETFIFEGISIHDSIDVALFDWNRFQGDVLIGKKDNIFVSGLMREAKTKPGENFKRVAKYFVESDKYNAKLTLSFEFEFDPRQRAKRKVVKEKKTISSLLSGGEKSSKSKFAGITIMGRPYPKNFRLRAACYCARDLVASDGNGLSDPYLEISYCGKKARTEVKKKTLNPQWMQVLSMSLDVPMPAQFAPAIRCAVYDWDLIGKNDLIARFTVPFQDCTAMMAEEKPRWYQLTDPDGNKLKGKGVYLGIEFMDPNDAGKKDPIFTINYETTQCDFHLLTIGVRGLKSRFGISKPHVTYAVPIAGEMREVKTDPSSQPSPKDANFLVMKKINVDLPKNYELSPVLSLYSQDNKFGGLLVTDIGNASIALEHFMTRVAADSIDWVVKEESKIILNERELKAELEAEKLAEMREFEGEQRVHELALLSIKELTEVRSTRRPFNDEISDLADKLEEKQLEILTAEEIEAKKEEMQAVRRKLKQPKKYKPEAKEDAGAGSNSTSTTESSTTSDMVDGTPATTSSKKKGVKRQQSKEEVADDSADDDDEEAKELEKDPEMAEMLEESESLDDEEYMKRQMEQQLAKEEAAKQAEEDEKKAEEERLLEEEKALAEEEENKKKKKKMSKKEKKKLAKEQKKKDKALLKAWDKANEEYCFDIDSKVPYNPEDFWPDYLKGRMRVDKELETDDRWDMQPFENVDMYTGQVGGLKLFGNDRRQVGTLKGLWKLTAAGANEKYPFGPGLKDLVVTRTVSCRLYVLDGYVAVATDMDGSSDPYLIVKLGRNKVSTRSRYNSNTLKPKFHEGFEFITKLPGPSKLTIEVWDYDGIGDDLIGITVIDIEDRWFSRDWRRLRTQPLERRQLANPRSKASYGYIKCWVDMMSKDDARGVPMTDVSLPPPEQFELRIIAWDAKDVVIKDTLTDQNDLRITCKLKLEDWQEQETDTHWRAKFGKGSWNWRLVFPVGLPLDEKAQLHMSIWDQDIFAASDSIGEINVALNMLLDTAYVDRFDKPRLTLRKDQTKRFWMDFLHSNFEGPQAKVRISAELMTAEESKKFPAGLGRGDPNTNPYLPPPEGRFRWTWNPFELLRQILGNRMCFKLYCFCYCLICIAITIYIGPQFIVNMFSTAVEEALFGSSD